MEEPLVRVVSHLTDHQWQSLSSSSSGTVVLYLPNLCCVMRGFASSVAGVAEAITPSLRHKALSPPIRHPTGCLAEAGGRMHIVIDSIHC